MSASTGCAPACAEGGEQAFGLVADGGLIGHGASILRTCATRSARGTSTWAGRSFHSSSVAFCGDLRAEDQVLEDDGAFVGLVPALDHGDGGLAFVGVFELVAEVLRVAEVDLGPDARVAQVGHHRHVIGHAVAVHHGDDDGAGGVGGAAALGVQGGKQAVDADGDAGGGDGLAGEALHEVVIAPAARDRAEAGACGPFRRGFQRSVRPRTPGRCSSQGRARRRGR